MKFDQLTVLAICTTTLYVKFFITLMIQGGARFKSGTRAPEDGKLSLAKGKSQSFGTEKKDVDERHILRDIRYQRIVLNDLENIPIGLIVFIISILCGGNDFFNCIGMITFTVARILHTISYAKELQPHRAIFWFFGILSIMFVTFNGLFSVLNK